MHAFPNTQTAPETRARIKVYHSKKNLKMQSRMLGLVSIIVGIMMMALIALHDKLINKDIELTSKEIKVSTPQFPSWPIVSGLLLLIGGTLMIITDKKVRAKFQKPVLKFHNL